jgi:hypothetical protein
MRRLLPDAQIAVSESPLMPGPLLNTERLVGELGFSPRYTLASGLEAYIETVRERRQPA